MKKENERVEKEKAAAKLGGEGDGGKGRRQQNNLVVPFNTVCVLSQHC